ncbi:MAG TPA: hypothetical protein VFV67_34075 [Actinophytocola sp.]|uniref:hypothetical protein n=1 Tax=Actinophytocola sp. TaxID=1872138 RepID=UPI002DBA7324|nr:hypothetical protein [Actinophytocola sp.]HEU5475696.1 hypothetical protein [Actinophytocola sp.]
MLDPISVTIVLTGVFVLLIIRAFRKSPDIREFHWKWIGLTLKRGQPTDDDPRPRLEETDDDPP